MPTVEEMRVIMDAETARLFQKLNEADRRMLQFQRNTEARLKAFDGYFRNVGRAAGALGGALSAKEISDYASAWTRVERALSSSEQVFGMALHSADDLRDLANASRMDLEAYSKTYARTAAAIRDYGHDSSVAAQMTTTMAMALKLGAATAQEQASSLQQFGQALNKGFTGGDEWVSIRENAPVAVEILSEKLKKSKGELAEMAEKGQLTTKVWVDALTSGAARIEAEFKRQPQTIDDAFTVLNNNVTAYVGKMDQATGASQRFVSVVAGVANNIETVGNTALVVGATLLSAFLPRIVASTASMAMLGAAGAAAASPLALIAAIVGGGAAALSLFGDKLTVSADGLVTVKDYATAIVDVIGARMTPMLQTAGELWQSAVGKLTAAMNGLPVTLDDVLGAVRKAVNFYVGLWVFAGKSVVASFQTLPAAIAEKMVDVANGVLAIVERMVSGVRDLLNRLPGIKIEAEVDLGRLANPLEGAGARAREAMRDAGKAISDDYVGAIVGGIRTGTDTIGAEIDAQARVIAERRKWLDGTTTKRAIETKRGKPPVDNELLKKMKKADEELNDLYRKSLESAGRYRDAVQAEYVKELGKFQEMLKEKLITQQQFDLARQRLAQVASKQMLEAAEKEFERLREVTDVVASSMEDAFSKFTESGKLDFRDMTRSILADMAKLIFKKTVIETLFGSSGKGFGLLGGLVSTSGVGSWFTSSTAAPGFAVGGSFSAGMPIRVHRDEMIVPEVPGRVVPANKVGGGASVSVALSIDARGATRDTLPALERQVAELQRNLPKIITETVADARDRSLLR